MAGRHSFRDPVTNVLKAHGFITQNQPGDLMQAEADDFALEPGKWRWDGSKWVSFTPPPAPVILNTDDVLELLVAKNVLKQKDVDDAKAAK